MKHCLALALLLASATAHAERYAITDTKVFETPDRVVDHVTVIIDGGKVTAIGSGLTPPADALVIDGKHRVVTAGFVDALSQLGLVEIDQEASGNDGRFDAAQLHAAYRADLAFDPRALPIPIARDGGITSAVVSPSGGLCAGQSAWESLGDAPTPTPPARAPAAMICALGADAIATRSRGQAIERLRELLADAATFGRARTDYEKNQLRLLSASRLDLEALQPVLAGKLPLVIHADAEADIRAALAIAAERKLRIAIAGGLEAWRVKAELAAAHVPVLLDPENNLPDTLTATDVRDDLAAVLDAAGVPVIVSTLGASAFARDLRQKVGNAIATGLPYAHGLAAVTTLPAALYGLPDRGTVTVGGRADLVLWTGDPFELDSRASWVFVDGVAQSAETHQRQLLRRYRTLPK